MKRYLALIALLASPLALGTNLTLTWIAPTTYTDGTPVTSGTAISYNVYGATQGQTKKLLTTVTTLTAVRSNVNPGVQCYAVSAVVATVESAQTPEVCATVPNPTPSSPSNLQVAVTVAANTIYDNIKALDRVVMLPVGTVPAGTSCLPDQVIVTGGKQYNAVSRAAVSWSGAVRPPVVFALCVG